MFEWAARPQGEGYTPVGVWVEDGVTLVVDFLPGAPGAAAARDVAARMEQADTIPEDFLERWASSGGPQVDRGPIYQTDRYRTPRQLATAVLGFVREEWDEASRRWLTDPAALT